MKYLKKNWHIVLLGLSVAFYYIIKYLIYNDKKIDNGVLKYLDKQSEIEQKKITKINEEIKKIEKKKIKKETLKNKSRVDLLGIIRRNRKRTGNK